MSVAEDHVRFQDDAAPYVLRALSIEEAAAFEGHLVACSECRDAVDELTPAADALPRAVEPFDAPESLKRSLMQVVEGEARERRREERGAQRRRSVAWPSRVLAGLRPRVAIAGAAVLIAVGVAIGWGVSGGGDGGDARTVAAQVDQSKLPRGSAQLEIRDGKGQLSVRGLPQPTGERVYMVWLDRDGRVVPAGSYFNVGADGSGAAAIPGDLDDVDAIYVTREVEGGVPSPTEDPVISART